METCIAIACFAILSFFFGGGNLILNTYKKIRGCPKGGSHQWLFYEKNNFGGRIYACQKCHEREVSGGTPLHQL